MGECKSVLGVCGTWLQTPHSVQVCVGAQESWSRCRCSGGGHAHTAPRGDSWHVCEHAATSHIGSPDTQNYKFNS